jgi:hypothetical protein
MDRTRSENRRIRRRAKLMRMKWGDLHMIAVGVRSPEIKNWLREHAPKWAVNRTEEVYYFPDAPTAIHFKLRWAGCPMCSNEQE